MIDILDKKDIIAEIRTNVPYGLEIFYEIDSTNLYLKRHINDIKNDIHIVIADSQTAGKGRFSRVFYSPENTGIYMSILIKKGSPDDYMTMTTKAAVAVSRTLDETFGIDTEIKWVNDILLDSKKVCGILVEGSYENGIQNTIVGIGINIYKPENGFPKEISNKAGYLSDKPIPGLRNKICGKIISAFLDMIFSENVGYKKEYIKKLNILGRRIKIGGSYSENDDMSVCEVVGINDDLSLEVKFDDGSVNRIMSGEITLHQDA